MASKGIILSRTELAKFLGVSFTSVDNFTRDGMPILELGSRGIPAKFNSADCIEWLLANKANGIGSRQAQSQEEKDGKMSATDRAKLRKIEIETEIAEIDLYQKKSLISPISEFEFTWSSKMAIIRQNIMTVPNRVVSQLLGCADETEFKDCLAGELQIALETAAGTDVEFDDE